MIERVATLHRQVFGLGTISDDDFPSRGTVSALAHITTFLTAARQLQIHTGFPITQAWGRRLQSTEWRYGSPDC